MRHPTATSHSNRLSHSNNPPLHRTRVLTNTSRSAKYRDDCQTGIHSPCRANNLCCGTRLSCIEVQKMLVNQFARACTTVLTLTLAGLSCVCTPAYSQTDADRISSLERRLEQSNQLIQQLEARIEQLERAGEARAQQDDTSAAIAQTAAPAPAEVAPQMQPIDASPDGVPLHAFADVGYVQSSHA